MCQQYKVESDLLINTLRLILFTTQSVVHGSKCSDLMVEHWRDKRKHNQSEISLQKTVLIKNKPDVKHAIFVESTFVLW